MQAITTIGLDIAKSVFQVHGVDASGQVVIRRQLKRRWASSRSCRPAWSVSKLAPHRIIGHANSRRLATPFA
jgi:transposase